MNQFIPKDSKYVPLTQQGWCCVPTCIQMVMLRHNIPLVPVEQIGGMMGLIVPKKDAKLFWNARTGKKPLSGYGTQAGKPQYGPNAVFRKLKIPFKMTWSLINKFKTYESFRNYLEGRDENTDTLICYDWGTLFDEEWHDGHVCLIDKIDMKKEEIRIIDPDFYAPKWRIITFAKLYEAMKYHGSKKSGGFWEISLRS